MKRKQVGVATCIEKTDETATHFSRRQRKKLREGQTDNKRMARQEEQVPGRRGRKRVGCYRMLQDVTGQ